jgi:hypothetical protein
MATTSILNLCCPESPNVQRGIARADKGTYLDELKQLPAKEQQVKVWLTCGLGRLSSVLDLLEQSYNEDLDPQKKDKLNAVSETAPGVLLLLHRDKRFGVGAFDADEDRLGQVIG